MADQNSGQNLELVAPIKKLKSSVWQYFGFYKIRGSEETHFDRTMCRLCNNLLAYNHGCTQNMRQHLIRSHEINLSSISSSVRVCETSDDLPTQSTTQSDSLAKADENLLEFVPPSLELKELVWQNFGFYKLKDSDDIQYDRTWCKLCNSLVPYDGNASNMYSHLSKHHGVDSKTDSMTNLHKILPTGTPDTGRDLISSKDIVFVKAKPSLKALVWNYFGFYKIKGTEKQWYDRTCCRLCKNLIKYSKGNTSGMRKHLQRSHQLDLSVLSQTEQDSTLAETPSQSWTELKKVLREQHCSNASCDAPIELEADGSPPQFCARCGLLLSIHLSQFWAQCASCCQMCGKLIGSSAEAHFCTRCGSFLHDEFVGDAAADTKQECAGSSSSKSTEKLDVKTVEVEASSRLDEVTKVKLVEQSDHQLDLFERVETTRSDESSDPSTCRECEFCEYKSNDIRELMGHLTSHLDPSSKTTPLSPAQVDELSSEFAEDQTERLHSLIENIKELKPHKPDFDWPAELMDSAAEGVDARLACDRCDFECEQQEELDAHLRSHNKTLKQIVRYCRKCNEEFQTLSQLRQHEKAASCEEKVLACDECDYMTSKVDSFRGHKRRNHGKIELKSCRYCERKFKRQRNLEEHMNTHTGCTPFQCDKCGKAFHTNSSWYKHKRNNCEPGLRERKLCSHCGREVINLSKHISDVHFNIKEFTCGTCKKSFGTQYHLDRHIRTHTGEKPFACLYCDYRASQKVVTDGHMKKCKFRLQGSDGSNSAGSC